MKHCQMYTSSARPILGKEHVRFAFERRLYGDKIVVANRLSDVVHGHGYTLPQLQLAQTLVYRSAEFAMVTVEQNQ